MANRIDSILDRARDTLADPDKTRWSDARLIRLLDEAHKDVCRRAKVLRARTEIPVVVGQAVYTIPDLLLLDRVLYDGERLDFTNHAYLDTVSYKWEEDEGTPEAVVYDKLRRQQLKLYPIPTPTSNEISYTFETGLVLENLTIDLSGTVGASISSTISNVQQNSFYGITDIDVLQFTDSGVMVVSSPSIGQYGTITNIDSVSIVTTKPDTNGLFGSISSVTNLEVINEFGLTDDFQDINSIGSLFGVVSDITTSDEQLIVYYIQQPKDIVNRDSILVVDPIFDPMLKYFIVGKALRDDMDTQNRAVGNEELQLYERDLQQAIRDDALDFTRNDNKQLVTPYYGGLGDGRYQNYSDSIAYQNYICGGNL